MAKRNLTLSRLNEPDLNIVLGLIDDLTQNLDERGRLLASAILSGAITFKDADLTIVDDVDGSKRFRFEASGISAGNKRVVTIPDADITVARIDAAQTFAGDQTFSGDSLIHQSSGATVGTSTLASAAAGLALLFVAAGDNTTSSRFAFLRFASLETSGQIWDIGLFGSKDYVIKNATLTTTPVSISATTGAVTLSGDLIQPFNAGSFTIPTGSFSSFQDECTISGTNEITMVGTAVLGVS